MLISWCFPTGNKFCLKIQDDVPLTLLYLSRINSDPDWFKNSCSKLYYCEKSVHLHSCSLTECVGSDMAKAKKPNMNSGLDTSQKKALQ